MVKGNKFKTPEFLAQQALKAAKAAACQAGDKQSQAAQPVISNAHELPASNAEIGHQAAAEMAAPAVKLPQASKSAMKRRSRKRDNMAAGAAAELPQQPAAKKQKVPKTQPVPVPTIFAAPTSQGLAQAFSKFAIRTREIAAC